MGGSLHRRLAISQGEFYEVPWAAGSPLLDVDVLPVQHNADSGWGRAVRGPWVYLNPGTTLPDRGWKVHVSALPSTARETAVTCWDACRELGVPFKVLRSRGLVLAGQQKYADPVASGKVVTCYPLPAQLEPLCELLAAQLRGRPAPGIVGELRIPDTPIHLRYGAFRAAWIPGPDGAPVPAVGSRPDVRGPRAAAAPEPPYVTALRARTDPAESRLDLTEIRLVHRSNAGGVYRARDAAGRPVLLKEARHHAGLDPGGTDARTRLRHEAAALERLAGTGAAPEPIEHLVVGESDFLVMELIDGTPLNAAPGRSHPAVRTDGDGPDAAAYLQWVDRVTDGAHTALAVVHGRGVEHRDVQPANLIDTGERIVLIDFESCAIDGVAVSNGVATPWFSHETGPDRDSRSVQRVRAALINPLAALAHRRPDLEAELSGMGLADLGVAPAPSTVVGPPDTAALVRGITAAADPSRDDRLFPGDAAQFGAPRGGLGLLHGAAGVLLALHRSSAVVDAGWVRWLADHALVDGPFPRGLGDGVDGVAWALAELGEIDTTERLVDRFVAGPAADPPAPVPWWRHGSAGRAPALAALGRCLGRDDLLRAARADADALVAAVRGPEAQPTGYRPGLCAGWSGIGLALLGLQDLVPDAVPLAHAALERELLATEVRGGCLLARDGRALLPYLGAGSAAAGLLAARLLAQPDLPEPAREVQRLTVEAARACCARPVVSFAGLLTGRAGLLAVLDELSAGHDPMVAEHRRRLDWHTVALAGGTSGLGVLGEYNLRCSADLATGAAGVLAALAARPGHQVTALLGIPPVAVVAA